MSTSKLRHSASEATAAAVVEEGGGHSHRCSLLLSFYPDAMLHAVIIITASGLILFQKEFALLPSSSSSLSSSPSLSQQSASYISLSSKSGQLAGILTAVINFSLSRLGGQVSYIQTDHVGVALAVHQQTKCTCAVFHQVADVRHNSPHTSTYDSDALAMLGAAVTDLSLCIVLRWCC